MNNKKTQELEKTYQLFIDSFLDLEFPIEQIDEFVDTEINGYGTTIDEHVTGLDDYIRLVHRQRDQSKGAELKVARRPVLQRINPNEDAALIIEELTVTLAFEDGNHEIPLRISSILHFIDGGWRVVHWHSSQPVASENDTWHLDEWRQKNEALQQLVDEKTADLAAKNKELEIEAALERIRSSANAMQDSTELADVIKVVFQETIALGFGAKACDLVIFDPVPGGAQFWISGDLNEEVIYARIPKLKIKHYTESLKAWERGDKLRSATLKGKSCQAYMRQIINKMEESNISYEIKELLLNLDTIHHTEAFTKHGLFRAASDEPLQQDEEEILVRFAKVFEQTYTRFLDLQKSEAQAREAQIEAALERVRSRSMAMRNTSELQEVINLLFNELLGQGVGISSVMIASFKNSIKDGLNLYMAARGQTYASEFHLPYIDNPALTNFVKSIEEGTNFYTEKISGKKKSDLFKHLYVNSTISYSNEQRDYLLKAKAVCRSIYRIGQTGIVIDRYMDEPFSDAENELLQRFGKVFEQTYTRFLDLQKAEAQTQEAQIEAALERVRAASMAMHKSSELQDVLKVVFNQFINLKLGIDIAIIALHPTDSKDWIGWTQSESTGYSSIHWPYVDLPVFNMLLNAWNINTPFTFSHTPEEKNIFWKEFFKLGILPKNREKIVIEAPGLEVTGRYLNHSGIHALRYSQEKFKPQETEIVARFAHVFEQAYTRFLDLQKAETQAREAQIEAALERVRAQAMAMHNTDDLGKTIEVYFEQLDTLSHTPIVRCGAGLLSKENTFAQMWTASRTPEGDTFSVEGTIDMQGHPLLESTYEHWLKQEEHTYVLQGEEIQEYYDYITNQVAATNNSDEALYFYFPMFAEGSFYVIANQEIPENELKVFRRFSSVLSLTYRRFNDLKKAEAQAREAEIELSLERIRAVATAMSTSSDLQDIVIAMRKEFVTLGHEVHYFWHMRWLPDRYDKAMTTGDGDRIGMVMRLPRHIHGDIPLVADWEKSDEPVLVFPMDADTAVNYVNKMVTLGDFEQLDPNAPTEDAIREIDGLTFVMARTTHGEIGYSLSGKVINPPKEAIDTLARFAGTFDLAYRRFEDLLQAEARGREAVKQASIDRVRAEIASMRSPKDLERITPLVWKELTVLGVPFFRCGVFIIKEEEEMVHAYLSTPTGKSLAALHIPFSETELGMIQPSIDNWRNQTVYREEWDQKQFIQNMQLFMKQGLIENAKQYQAGSPPPEKLVLQLVPFKQGMLYVGNSEPLIQEHVELMQYLASAFAVAYARYEDFVQLEDAKRNIEHTLTDLKAAQNQLVHSEKMASLGELTAGIAHEIQNPLNFVNNFSDLNKELLAELKEAIRENDQEEIEALTNDLLANEEKVTHHGKRAEQIVKSMLQHSRTSSGEKELTDINALADEYLRLSYHGLRAKDKNGPTGRFNADFKAELDPSLPKINVVPQDIGRVLLNLINNAFQAVSAEASAKVGSDYKPEVTVSTKSLAGQIEITVSDNGPGIPDEIKDKIFQPFFTTKPTGEGTGLGLSMSYDIVTKGHGGTLEVQTKTSEWTTFSISLPIV
ncbi:MAG: ATP-binding protein [Cyclobacteriaceae bacterium]